MGILWVTWGFTRIFQKPIKNSLKYYQRERILIDFEILIVIINKVGLNLLFQNVFIFLYIVICNHYNIVKVILWNPKVR